MRTNSARRRRVPRSLCMAVLATCATSAACLDQEGTAPLPDPLPTLENAHGEGLPPHFDRKLGWTEYRTPQGGRAVVITQANSDAQSSPGLALYDTLEVTKNTNAHFFGYLQYWKRVDESERLIVGGQGTGKPVALLKFAIPPGTPCDDITSATIRLKAASVQGQLLIRADPVNSFWVAPPPVPQPPQPPVCSPTAHVLLYLEPFEFPQVSAFGSGQNVAQSCQYFYWDVTTLAKQWCSAEGGVNNGVVLREQYSAPPMGSRVAMAQFYSMQGYDPPVMFIYYQ